MVRWAEVGDGVLVRRHDELDLSLGLVVGEHGCLVVDTGGDQTQGAEFAAAVREVTTLPWTVVVTHGHFDHAFGTAAFGDCEVWGHPGCAAELVSGGERQRAFWVEHYRAAGRDDVARRIEGTRVVAPQRLVAGEAEIDLGGRTVRLLHPGPGHTGHDLVAHVPDAGVVFAGDLVEQGAPPAFEDAFPLAWPTAVLRLMTLGAATVVPGHGDPVDVAFVAAQRAELLRVAALCRAVVAGEMTAEEAQALSPYPERFTADALGRASL
ncbi:MBL fold metallo-hydrolase [Sphaerisporangium rubeum]|uniref:Glyoxylase-like metal-dependent hydrolase (Beta-lactamase superfamily II) n=1 Tax=Sphaerisporangium rubeum TaxID=321317 RepID=A0A7X0IF25_9ACTN|nr:MBL fold metallo-hydrolase [Sphaerisporangium rubeum]MBB6472497.1 glyoxylase-like metal-dependent hydrolase (beta-lactamase superfamily II) [Sphaerisporangium rubeum]